MSDTQVKTVGIDRKKKIIVAAVVTFGLVLCGVLASTGIKAFAKDKGVNTPYGYYEAYSDLDSQGRDGLLEQFRPHMFSHNYYLSHPMEYQTVIGLPSKSVRDGETVYNYTSLKYRSRNWFNKVQDDENYFPTINLWAIGYQNWEGYEEYSSDPNEEPYASAVYGGRSRTVRVPEYIVTADTGKKLKVKSVYIKSNYVQRVIFNGITEKISLQCPKLKWLENTDSIKEIKSLQNCIMLEKLPYMPYLEQIDSLAFMGCFSLKHIPLGNHVNYIAPDAIGWYDVILGNYDYETRLGDDVTRDYGFLDNDRIYGVTVYANSGSNTYFLIDNLYNNNFEYLTGLSSDDDRTWDEEYVKFMASHVSVKPLSEFPGVEVEPYVEDELVYVPVSAWTDLPNDYDFPDLTVDDFTMPDEKEAEGRKFNTPADYARWLWANGKISLATMMAITVLWGMFVSVRTNINRYIEFFDYIKDKMDAKMRAMFEPYILYAKTEAMLSSKPYAQAFRDAYMEALQDHPNVGIKLFAYEDAVRRIIHDPEYAAKVVAELDRKIEESGMPETYRKVKETVLKAREIQEKIKEVNRTKAHFADISDEIEGNIGGNLQDERLLEIANILEQVYGYPVSNPIKSLVFMHKLANNPEFWTASMTEKAKIIRLITQSIEEGGTL